MQRKNMIWVAVEDVHTMVVGSLAKYRHKRRMANDKGYCARHTAARRQPMTFATMLDLQGSEQPVFASLSDALGLSSSGSMRAALGV